MTMRVATTAVVRTSSAIRATAARSPLQFMQTLIKLSVGRYIPSDTLDVSDAVDKLMGERVSRLLPPDAKIDPNTFRDERLYTLEVESMFRTHLNSLHALFEAYAGVGPTGQPDLMSLPEFVSLLWHMELLDDDFTAKMVHYAFSGLACVSLMRSRRGKGYSTSIWSTFLRRSFASRGASDCRRPRWCARRVGDRRGVLHGATAELGRVCVVPRRARATARPALGRSRRHAPKIALETLLSVICSAIRGAAGSSATSQDLTTEEVKMHMAKKQQELEE